MAGRDTSKSLSELDTEDLGLENTDFTSSSLSLSGDDDRSRHSHCRVCQHKDDSGKVTKQLIERKQLLHDIQLLKIELSQKNMILDTIKADHMHTLEDLQERLTDALHQKQIFRTKLESQLKIQQEESKRRQEHFRREVETVLKRQQQLEESNSKLTEKAGDVRRSLHGDLYLTDEQYFELRTQNEETLSIRQIVMLKIYETTNPLSAANKELKSRVQTEDNEIKRLEDELIKSKEMFDEERQAHAELQLRHQKLSVMLADTKSQVQQGNYKIENYERVKSERDLLERDLQELKKVHSYLDNSHQIQAKDKDEINKELTSTKQSVSLLRQDKEYLNRQIVELQHKVIFGEEKMQQLSTQLEDVKRAREELYEKYVESRDQYKTEYENKLREELELIRVRTNAEIDRLRTSTKEMYERENRNLREARDTAIAEKDRAAFQEKETNTKYENILAEFRQLQVTGDNRVSELQNELKIRSFENERTQIVYEETVKNLKECQLENEKFQKKLEVLTKEYYNLQNVTDNKMSSLESQLGEKTSKLVTYEKLEQELDDVVMQAAEIENEDEAERVLFSYGYGANVPSTAKRRLKQSVHLARRVLQLERANTSLRKDIERENEKNKQLAGEVKSANSILDQAQQPYNYLIDSIRQRDTQINKQTQHISTLETDIRQLEKERAGLIKVKNEMSADLERLLQHREELSVMKQVAINLHSQQPSFHRSQDMGYSSLGQSQQHHRMPAVMKEFPQEMASTNNPEPTLFAPL